MINEKIIELIQAGVDRELDDSQQAELERILETSAEARACQSKLLKLCGLLEEEQALELPRGLHRKIVDSISLPSKSTISRGFGALPGFLRYGMAAAAGLLLAIGVMDTPTVNLDSRDLDNMVGTIMQNDGSVGAVRLDGFSFDTDEIASSVSLQQRDRTLVLDVILTSTHPVDITVNFSGDGLVFDAIAQIQSELKSIGVNGQAIQISGQGRQHFAVLLHRESGPVEQAEASFKLNFASNGKVVKEGTLVTK